MDTRYHDWGKDLKNVHYNLHYSPVSYSERALVQELLFTLQLTEQHKLELNGSSNMWIFFSVKTNSNNKPSVG